MNIFVLDESPIIAAQFQHNRHVVKMILESAQMLSTAVRDSHANAGMASLLDDMGMDVDSLYKSTHLNHPCSIWVRESQANFAWLTIHLDALIQEYTYRYPGRIHACSNLRHDMAGITARLAGLPHFSGKHYRSAGFYSCDSDGNLCVNPQILEFAATHTPFAICMPDRFKRDNALDSYRTLYANDKIHQAQVGWKNRQVPYWLLDYVDNPLSRQRLADLTEENERARFEGVIVKPRRSGWQRKPYVPPVFNDSDYANPDAVRMPASFRIR